MQALTSNILISDFFSVHVGSTYRVTDCCEKSEIVEIGADKLSPVPSELPQKLEECVCVRDNQPEPVTPQVLTSTVHQVRKQGLFQVSQVPSLESLITSLSINLQVEDEKLLLIFSHELNHNQSKAYSIPPSSVKWQVRVSQQVNQVWFPEPSRSRSTPIHAHLIEFPSWWRHHEVFFFSDPTPYFHHNWVSFKGLPPHELSFLVFFFYLSRACAGYRTAFTIYLFLNQHWFHLILFRRHVTVVVKATAIFGVVCRSFLKHGRARHCGSRLDLNLV